MAENVIYQFGAPPLPFGAVDYLVPGQFPLYVGIVQPDFGAHDGKALLMVASPFNPATVSSPTIYPAMTHGRTSVPTDAPPNTYVPASLVGNPTLQVSLFSGANPAQSGAATFGVLDLIDTEGHLDGLLELGWDNASIELRRGNPGALLSTFETVAKMTAAGIVGGTRAKSIKLRDLAWRLTTAELHGERYDGAGGLGGDETLKGRLRPYAAGYVFNITPTLINAVKLVYQVSYTSIAAVTAVRDGGALLAAGADYPDYASLAAAAIGGGTYATCRAKGLIRLGASPAKDITADVTGDADVVNGLGAPTTRGRIVRRIATGLGTVKLSDTDQIDFASFQSFEARQPAPCGWYWDSSAEVTKADAINEVLAGCLGFWLVRPNGQMSIGQVEAPSSVGPTLFLTYPAPGAGESRLGEPEITDELLPRRSTLIGWQRNYTIQARSVLAGVVTDALAQIYAQPARYATKENAFVKANYPSSPTVTLEANYRDEVDAIIEAERQSAICEVLRRRYTISISIMDPVADVVGQYARISNLNRLGWGASKTLLVCGFDAANGSADLHFWG